MGLVKLLVGKVGVAVTPVRSLRTSQLGPAETIRKGHCLGGTGQIAFRKESERCCRYVSRIDHHNVGAVYAGLD